MMMLIVLVMMVSCGVDVICVDVDGVVIVGVECACDECDDASSDGVDDIISCICSVVDVDAIGYDVGVVDIVMVVSDREWCCYVDVVVGVGGLFVVVVVVVVEYDAHVCDSICEVGDDADVVIACGFDVVAVD